MATKYGLILLLLSVVRRSGTVCSPIYGQPPCTYLPAPPGHAPSCARPGYTYCEHPHNYPGQLIQHLVEKWRHDHKTLIMDETQYDFNAYTIPYDKYPSTINQPIYGPINSISNEKLYPEPIYIPKPTYTILKSEGKTYIPPPPPQQQQQNHHQVTTQNLTEFSGYPQDRPPSYYQQQFPRNQIDYGTVHKNTNQPYQYHQNHYSPIGDPQIASQNEWWKRHSQQNLYNHLRNKRSLKLLRNRRSKFLDENTFLNTTRIRTKRQSASVGQKLCETRSRYVMPRAAANKEGQWLYLVNIPGYTQQVNTESCASQQCNGLCSLPTGYTSRCEQKYVQKRLVALDGSGATLMNDLFWFPVCCACMITT